MKCSNCGQKVRDGASFCPNCGSKIKQHQSQSPGSIFKSECGPYRRYDNGSDLLIVPISESKRSQARTNFNLDKNEEILVIRDTGFWNSGDQGMVLTDKGVYVIVDNEKPDEGFNLPWEIISKVEYQEQCLYFYDNQGEHCPIHMSYFLKDMSNESTVANVGRLLARIFTKMAQAVEQQPDEWETAIEEINQLAKANKGQEAANRLQQCAIENPENASYWYEWLGRVYFYGLHDNANALKAFNKALENANLENTEWVAKIKYYIYGMYGIEYLEKEDNSLLLPLRKLSLYAAQYGNDTENIRTDDRPPLTLKEDGYNDFIQYDELYRDKFLEMPYRERKVLMPVKQYTDLEQEVVKVISIDNLPKDIVFPFGHPIANQLYIGHPLLTHKYIPFENYQKELIEDKLREFCSIAQSLGATEISIECLNSSASDGSYNSTKNGSGNVNYRVTDVNGSYNEKDSSRWIEDLRRSISFHQTYSPKTAPVLPENLVWYNNEPSWQRLYTQRMNGSLLTHQERIESRKSQMVESNEMTQIKGEFETLFLSAGGEFTKTEEMKYQIQENAVLAINITFAPIDQLTGSASSAAALQQPASPANNTLSLSAGEQEYINEVKECLVDGEISSGERRLLNKLSMKLGISKERAAELEASLLQPQSTLTEDEQEYLEAFQDAMEDGVISEKSRRLLDRIMRMNNISETRAKEIEQMYSAQ